MIESIGIMVATLVPPLLTALGGTVLEQGREVAIEKSKDFLLAQGGRGVRQVFRLDEKEQVRHLEQALNNAAERGLVTLHTQAERDQYKEVLQTLAQPGPLGEALRREVMPLFTFADTPDFAALSDLYNQRRRFYDGTFQERDVAPSLRRFFTALEQELYADPYFRPRISDALHLRLSAETQHALLDVVALLHTIDARLAHNYHPADFARDTERYRAYIERTCQYLQIRGFVPKEHITDPELQGIFVPLRLTERQKSNQADDTAAPAPDELVAALERESCLVLLGGPGSGKSTATKYLAWCHAAANQGAEQSAALPVLSGSPLPLRIELWRLSEERTRANYDFLTYATEVQLKRDGIDVPRQMFEELLARRCLLLLFDGLDEVATPHERLQLVNEIQHFALCYPGNRVLVTSRPVGYEVAPISHPLFAHATVQPFDDVQIQHFLENWYTAVLHLSPIPPREREEIHVLLKTLQANPRLHKLAENPLILTMMTDLHRYERLPDRRIQVYDRCADLLLDTWAKLRGTVQKWKDVEMGKESQYACVAHLGFLLHERAQKNEEDEDEVYRSPSKDKEQTQSVDVTAHFLQRHIQHFLDEQALIEGRAKQGKQAELFVALIREEAGLLVERGTDKQGQPLYSFVHRTFQEYFAAADVYERYQQAIDLKVISDFLEKHLHDPHWREVTLLLLSKLRLTHVTNLLQQLLLGKIVSKRSCYTHIVQQDLFFVCDCLLEGIQVQNTLVTLVVSRLCDVVKTSRFPKQQEEALEYLSKLSQTQQYGEPSRKALKAFATQAHILKSATRLQAIKTLYISSTTSLEEQQFALAALQQWLQSTELPVEQIRDTAKPLYYNVEGSAEQQYAINLLKGLLLRSELSVEQLGKTAVSLYGSSATGSAEQQYAFDLLKRLLLRSDLSVEQQWLIAVLLYYRSTTGSAEQQFAFDLLKELRPELSVELQWQTAASLYIGSATGSAVQQYAFDLLKGLLLRSDLSVEQIRETAESLYDYSAAGSAEQQYATDLLKGLLLRSDLSVEQIRETAESLYRSSIVDSVEQYAIDQLKGLLQRPELSVEQWQTAVSLYNYSATGSVEQLLATSILFRLIMRNDMPKNLDRYNDVYDILRRMVPLFHELPN